MEKNQHYILDPVQEQRFSTGDTCQMFRRRAIVFENEKIIILNITLAYN